MPTVPLRWPPRKATSEIEDDQAYVTSLEQRRHVAWLVGLPAEEREAWFAQKAAEYEAWFAQKVTEQEARLREPGVVLRDRETALAACEKAVHDGQRTSPIIHAQALWHHALVLAEFGEDDAAIAQLQAFLRDAPGVTSLRTDFAIVYGTLAHRLAARGDRWNAWIARCFALLWDRNNAGSPL